MVDHDEPRLKTEVRVKLGLRRCMAEGVFATQVRRGDPDSGDLALKLNLLDGTARILVQQRDLAGRLGWVDVWPEAPKSDGEAEAYLLRAALRDPDLWIVEIEDRRGWHPF